MSLAPHLTECIYALEEGARLVAVGDFDDYPPEAAGLPRAGGYLNPDLERITALSPKLLIVPGKHPKVADFAALNRIPLLHVHMDSFETINTGILQLGEALECADKARALVESLDAQRAALAEALDGVKPPRTLIITYRHSHDLNTLYTVGNSSFVSEVVHLAGGENIFGNETAPYFEASKETVLAYAPEVILEFHAGEQLSPEQAELFRQDWTALPGLPAVANNRIYLIMEPHALRPGPRIMEIARMIAGLLHPGAKI